MDTLVAAVKDNLGRTARKTPVAASRRLDRGAGEVPADRLDNGLARSIMNALLDLVAHLPQERQLPGR